MSRQVESINVEVAYARPERQDLIPLRLPGGSTVSQAIDASGILARLAAVGGQPAVKAGIYGKAVGLDTVLRDKDRVEIYRPLLADPKEIRRQRLAKGQAMKKGAPAE